MGMVGMAVGEMGSVHRIRVGEVGVIRVSVSVETAREIGLPSPTLYSDCYQNIYMFSQKQGKEVKTHPVERRKNDSEERL